MPAPEGVFVDDLPSDAGDEAPLVVLVHGTMDRHQSFARVRSRLMASCHVISYDRRGYAASREALPQPRGIDDHVRDLEAILDGRRATLAGHSYGGTVVLTLAARRPDLAGAILAYEPPLAWLERWPTPDGSRNEPFAGVTAEEAAAAFLRRMVGEDRYERLPLRTRQEAEKDGQALVAEMTAIRNDPAPFDPRDVEVPAIIARGELTSDHHVWATELLAAELPNASLRIVHGARHGGHQSHPRELAALIEEAVLLSGEATRAT
jgi:pimeloyl-ACP methyl ester carboxylesterase